MPIKITETFKRIEYKYIAIALLPLFALLYRPMANAVILSYGESVLLETMPVDPRDILRGDYVRLSYRISTIDPAEMPGVLAVGDSDLDRDVYVVLRKDVSGVGHVSEVSPTRPPGGLYLKARMTRRFRKAFSFDYGLGAYYVPEGTGRELEKAVRDNSALADVRVLRGRGVIKKLEIVP